ncbi:MAG TPA: hypothetical protein VFU47_10970, partial [Armatimonadota bacterium]|nr:hypothetical protein [Armatimonadota bacterium]
TANGVPEAAQGLFVGVTPGEERKQFDGDTDWDVGFLLLNPGWLAYYGDQVWFCLRPDQVDTIEVYPPGKSGPLTEVRLNVRWRDAAAGLAGRLSFAVRSFRSRAESRVRLEALRDQLQAWKSAPQPAAGWQGQPLPPVQVPGGTPVPLANTEPGAFGRQLLIGIPLAIVGALVMAGLKKGAGIDIPLPAGIAVVIGLTFAGSQALESWRRQRRG